MSFNIVKLILIALLGTLLAVYTNCGKPSPLTFSNGYYAGPTISYDAFKATVWPITRANCVSCHSEISPMHAADDVTTAHNAAITKVNFANIPASRLVAKLRDENHNCWSDCSANAAQIEAAIAQWNDIRNTQITDSEPTDYAVYTKETDTLENEFNSMTNSVSSNTVKINLEAASLRPPMVLVRSPDGNYVTVPSIGQNLTSATDAQAGTATINFRVPTTAQYRLWGYVHGPTTNDNNFFANITRGNTSMNGGARNLEITPVNTRLEWRSFTGLTANLTAGLDYTFEFRQREDGVRAQGFILTADSNFNGIEVNDFFGVTLSFDLSSLVKVPGTLFQVDVVDYDLHTYKFSRPRIVSPSGNFKVKNIKLLVNGHYNSQHSTYTIVDKITTPADGLLSNYSMIVIKDRGLAFDRIKFSFEELYQSNATATTGGNGGGTGTISQNSLEAYEATVYPISRSSAYACVGCHMNVGPRHSSDNSQTAHDATLSIVNFNTPSQSRIVRKVREERHNCGANCDNIANLYESAILEWRNRRQ